MRRSFQYIFKYSFLLLWLNTSAQDYVITLQHWGMRDGLSDRLINCLFQDDRGFIWIGTRHGLNRFDGYKFVTYTKAKNNLPFDEITDIAQDASGKLWLRGAKYDHNKKNLVPFNPILEKTMPVRDGTIDFVAASLLTMKNGDILASDKEHILHIYNPAKGWRKMDPGLTGSSFSILNTGRDNSIWIDTGPRELVKVDSNGKVIGRISTVSDIRAIYGWRHIRDGFVLTDSRHAWCLGANDELEDVTGKLPRLDSAETDLFFFIGPDSIAWRQGKLYQYRKGLLRNFTPQGEQELNGYLRCVWHDRQGGVWIGNAFGIYQLSVTRSKFRKILSAPSFTFGNRNSFRNIAISEDSIYAMNDEKQILTAPLPLHHIDSGSKFGVAQNRFFTGTTLNATAYHSATRRRSEDCYSTYEIQKDRILLGNENGLRWYDPSARSITPFTKYNQFKELAHSLILEIHADRHRQIWIFAETGLYTFDTARGITERYSSGDTGRNYLPAIAFNNFVEDSDCLWLATSAGLIRWDKPGHRYRLFTKSDGLANDNINAVCSDNLGRLWLSSDYGIMLFDKKTYNNSSFLVENGITYNEFNRMSHYKDESTGEIYFGSLNGVTAFDPKDFDGHDLPEDNPPLAVIALRQFTKESNTARNNTAAAVAGNIIDLYPNESLTVEFALLNYNNPQGNIYFWKIGGVDTSWKMQRETLLRFETLPYGNQILHVKAVTVEGARSRNELTIEINVIPPLYLRWWFIAGVLSTLISSAVMLYGWRISRLKRSNERLEAIIRERTYDLHVSLEQKDLLMREIHHRIRNNLQVIITLLDLQLSRVHDPAARKALTESESRVRSMALIHQHLYQNGNVLHIGLSTLVDDLFTQIAAIYGNNGREITFYNDIPDISLDIDTSIPIGIIVNELVTNSFKYAFGAGDGYIKLSLQRVKSHYALLYRDSGPGIAESTDLNKPKSLGMVVIKNLSRQLGGSFKYDQGLFTVYFKTREGRKQESYE
jgi:two-component sensor histidine kinase/ligand-binding sensor domain-containing protein